MAEIQRSLKIPSHDVRQAAGPAYRGDQPFVFVSYSHLDSEAVFSDVAKLQACGFRIWYDAAIDGAQVFTEEIYDALSRAKAVLLYASPQSALSDYVRKEVCTALGQLKKPLIAVNLSNTQLTGTFALLLSDLHVLTRDQPTPREYFLSLLRALPVATCDPTRTNDYDGLLALCVDSMFERGTAALAGNDFPAAVTYFSRVLDFDPGCARAYQYRGRCRLHLRELRAARLDFLEASRLDPGIKVPRTVEGMWFVCGERIESVIRWLRRFRRS